METPTATPSRAVRYECLCLRCGVQFELPNESSPQFCGKCAPKIESQANAAVEAVFDWACESNLLPDKANNKNSGYVMVFGRGIVALFASTTGLVSDWAGHCLVPIGCGCVTFGVSINTSLPTAFVRTGIEITPHRREALIAKFSIQT